MPGTECNATLLGAGLSALTTESVFVYKIEAHSLAAVVHIFVFEMRFDSTSCVWLSNANPVAVI